MEFPYIPLLGILGGAILNLIYEYRFFQLKDKSSFSLGRFTRRDPISIMLFLIRRSLLPVCVFLPTWFFISPDLPLIGWNHPALLLPCVALGFYPVPLTIRLISLFAEWGKEKTVSDFSWGVAHFVSREQKYLVSRVFQLRRIEAMKILALGTSKSQSQFARIRKLYEENKVLLANRFGQATIRTQYEPTMYVDYLMVFFGCSELNKRLNSTNLSFGGWDGSERRASRIVDRRNNTRFDSVGRRKLDLNLIPTPT